ncbi:hypothetical protein ACFLY3_05055, partial [Chloroflexota bacterium]
HLVAVFQCGDFIRQNVVPACQECDDSKGLKEYHDWMRNSNSKHSLKRRGMVRPEIEKRIKMIEEWQDGYKHSNEKELFGDDYYKYFLIIKRMEALCKEGESLALKIKAKRNEQV